MYNCNWLLALTSVCLVGLVGWTAAPDACEGMRLVFHNGTLPSCLSVTDIGLARSGTLDDCPGSCDRLHYRNAKETSRRRLETSMQRATWESSCGRTCSSTCKVSPGDYCGVPGNGGRDDKYKPICEFGRPQLGTSGGFPGCSACWKYTCPAAPPPPAPPSPPLAVVCNELQMSSCAGPDGSSEWCCNQHPGCILTGVGCIVCGYEQGC